MNGPVGCPAIAVCSAWSSIAPSEYHGLIRAPELSALVVRRDGRSTWSADPDEDAFEVSPPTRRLLTHVGWSRGVTVLAVPGLRHHDDRWKSARAIALSRRDFPRTLVEAGAGPTIIMRAEEVNTSVLTHEVMHVLIDYPRDVNRGDEHVGDPDRVCCYGREATGWRLTPSECAWIRGNPLLAGANDASSARFEARNTPAGDG